MIEVAWPAAEDVNQQIQKDRDNQSSEQYHNTWIAHPVQQIGDANGDSKPIQTPGRKIIKFGQKCGKKWRDTVKMRAQGFQINRHEVGGLERVHRV